MGSVDVDHPSLVPVRDMDLFLLLSVFLAGLVGVADVLHDLSQPRKVPAPEPVHPALEPRVLGLAERVASERFHGPGKQFLRFRRRFRIHRHLPEGRGRHQQRQQ
jgi:hypothetical protein